MKKRKKAVRRITRKVPVYPLDFLSALSSSRHPTYWTRADGSKILVTEMSPDHLLNAMNFFERWTKSLETNIAAIRKVDPRLITVNIDMKKWELSSIEDRTAMLFPQYKVAKREYYRRQAMRMQDLIMDLTRQLEEAKKW